jgi:hypothetical protein
VLPVQQVGGAARRRVHEDVAVVDVPVLEGELGQVLVERALAGDLVLPVGEVLDQAEGEELGVFLPVALLYCRGCGV